MIFTAPTACSVEGHKPALRSDPPFCDNLACSRRQPILRHMPPPPPRHQHPFRPFVSPLGQVRVVVLQLTRWALPIACHSNLVGDSVILSIQEVVVDAFGEKVESLAARSKAAERQAMTEEATKTSVVMPFLQALGFDVFDLDEVVPEFCADVGIKKGEKVDYAVKIDGRISMLIEAKPINTKLGDSQYSQLFRYFTVTDARLAILTNGREVWFFSDTEEPNKMDKKPFFQFDFQKHDKDQVADLARFQKGIFQIGAIIEAASNMKYTEDAAKILRKQLSDPDDDFVRFIGKQFYDGTLTKSVVETIKPAIQTALDQLVKERIQDRLSITFQDTKPAKPQEELADEGAEDGVFTTEEELDAFRIVKAIAAKIVPSSRIFMRDSKSYCAILLDDNNRRPICRLYFNSNTTKNVVFFDAEKNETKIRVSGAEDIYEYWDKIETVLKSYIQ